MMAMSLNIDQATASVVVGILIFVAQIYSSWKLSQVHTLVNSNFTEAKAARLVAEAALKTSQDLNTHLQQQLDAKTPSISSLKADVTVLDPGKKT